MDISSVLAPTSSTPTTDNRSANSAGELGSDEFYQLLVTQLTNQDPLEPMGNDELLRQISSIREIELSSTLTESLERLTGQQHFSATSGLIGQYVTAKPGEDGSVQSGLIVGVRFDESGQAILQMSSGAELPLEQIGVIQSPMAAAKSLIGQTVAGLSRKDADSPELAEGVVTAVTTNDAGEPQLELDTGETIDLRDVLAIGNA